LDTGRRRRWGISGAVFQAAHSSTAGLRRHSYRALRGMGALRFDCSSSVR
jgi:hypothetical protein